MSRALLCLATLAVSVALQLGYIRVQTAMEARPAHDLVVSLSPTVGSEAAGLVALPDSLAE